MSMTNYILDGWMQDNKLLIQFYLRGMQPLGSSAWVSWIRTFWKSTNTDLSTSSMNLRRLLHTGFRQIVGWVYCGDQINNSINHLDVENINITNLQLCWSYELFMTKVQKSFSNLTLSKLSNIKLLRYFVFLNLCFNPCWEQLWSDSRIPHHEWSSAHHKLSCAISYPSGNNEGSHF